MDDTEIDAALDETEQLTKEVEELLSHELEDEVEDEGERLRAAAIFFDLARYNPQKGQTRGRSLLSEGQARRQLWGSCDRVLLSADRDRRSSTDDVPYIAPSSDSNKTRRIVDRHGQPCLVLRPTC